MRNFLFFFLLSFYTFAQDATEIKTLDSLCYLFKQVSLEDQQPNDSFVNLYSDYIVSKIDLSRTDRKNQFNVTKYKSDRLFQKYCTDFDQVNLKFLPFSDIVDIENIFNLNEIKNMSALINEIKTKNRLEIFVITINEYSPYTTKEDFAYQVLLQNRNNIFKKGSLVLLINQQKREIRISTDDVAKEFVKDELIKSLIDEKILPQFKQNDFYKGIYNTLIELDILTR